MHYILLIHPNLNAIYFIVWSGSPFNHIKKNHAYYYKNVVLNYFLATLFSDLKYMYIWRDFVSLKSYHLHQFLINKWKFCHSLLDDKMLIKISPTTEWENDKHYLYKACNTSSSLRLNDAGMVNGTFLRIMLC